jgi:hypothetical protein
MEASLEAFFQSHQSLIDVLSLLLAEQQSCAESDRECVEA